MATIDHATLLKFRFLHSLSELESVETEWRALEATASRPSNLFQSYDWCWHWCNAMCQHRTSDWSPLILTGWAGKRLVLVFPLAVLGDGALHVREARWLGEPLTQYGDIIVADDPGREAWIVEAWKTLVARRDIDIIHLRKVRADATIAPCLAKHAYGLPGKQKAPAMDLTRYSDFDDLLASRKKRQIKTIARRRNRLDTFGDLRFEMHQTGFNALESAASALNFKKAWVRHAGAGNKFDDEKVQHLIQQLARGKTHPVQCLVSSLYIDREPAAFEIGYGWKKRYYAHIGAYNPWLGKFGPGKILIQETIAALMERGFETYDLLAPEDSYKIEWSNTAVKVSDHALPLSLRGTTHLGVYLKVLRPGMREIYERMPIPIRRKLSRLTSAA